jgi:O-antigen/teichoic acid export membrane protein
MFQLFTPVIFHFRGPVRAGQMGMTWHLVSIVASLAGALMGPKLPRFGSLVAKRDFRELDQLFRRTFLVITLSLLGGGASLWAGIWLLNMMPHRYAEHFAGRLLPPSTTALFLAGRVLFAFGVPLGGYLLAHKRQPHFVVSIVGAVLIPLGTWLSGRRFGADGVGMSFMLVATLLLATMASIWFKCRQRWHSKRGDARFPACDYGLLS